LPLREKRETDGWGPWSVKAGILYAHAPARALDAANGPLRVLPGTHTRGVMTDDEVHAESEKIPATECHAKAGAIVVMKPLLIHASSKSIGDAPRRVLHIEYAASLFTDEGLELAIA
jgi:ectoine hydroxylase-related dioxygenase (phytanoyl-CoA dioxygenase family)